MKLEVPDPPLDAAEFKPGRWSKRKVGAERWVRPSLVVEVAFGEWTADKRIRHAVFRGYPHGQAGEDDRPRAREEPSRPSACPRCARVQGSADDLQGQYHPIPTG